MNPSPFGAALIYSADKVSAFIGYENNNRNTKYTQMGVAYDFGPAKVMGSWSRNVHGSDPVNSGVVVNGVSIPGAAITGYGIGVNIPLSGGYTIRGGYGEATSDAPNAVPAQKVGVGLMYTFIKGTYVYTNIANSRALGNPSASYDLKPSVDFGIHTEF